MGHHKRGRPKNRRAGCLMCKPQKANGVARDKARPPSEYRELQPERTPKTRNRRERPFALEYRFTRNLLCPTAGKWQPYRSYRTERERLEALRHLRRTAHIFPHRPPILEYRLPEGE